MAGTKLAQNYRLLLKLTKKVITKKRTSKEYGVLCSTLSTHKGLEVQICDSIFQEKAEEFATGLGIDDLHFSDGWLDDLWPSYDIELTIRWRPVNQSPMSLSCKLSINSSTDNQNCDGYVDNEDNTPRPSVHLIPTSRTCGYATAMLTRPLTSMNISRLLTSFTARRVISILIQRNNAL